MFQVVAKVVGRQDLVSGMSGGGNSGSRDSGPRGSTYGAGGGDDGMDVVYDDADFPLHPCFFLSREERDVRMAELQSLGVDLPNDTLVTLLRYRRSAREAAWFLFCFVAEVVLRQLCACGRFYTRSSYYCKQQTIVKSSNAITTGTPSWGHIYLNLVWGGIFAAPKSLPILASSGYVPEKGFQ